MDNGSSYGWFTLNGFSPSRTEEMCLCNVPFSVKADGQSSKLHLSTVWNEQALQNRTLGTEEWYFIFKAIERGIILSIVDIK